MSLPSEILPVGLLGTGAAGAAGGYEIERSLRFNSADSAYLSRTPASAGNRKTWTWAGWIKRSAFDTVNRCLLSVSASGVSDNDHFNVFLNNDGKLQISGYNTNWRTPAQVFRDVSAWQHWMIVADTSNATPDNRLRVYVNGSEITTWTTKNNPGLDFEFAVNKAVTWYLAASLSESRYVDSYLADIHFIDGQALTPTSFGEFDANGIWQPVAYAGEYGTNGFHLDFADNSSAAALGYDAAGSNDWTVNNLSVTAGAGNDSLVDSPTNYGEDTGAGGEVRGNYCTMSPLQLDTITLANGNLDINRSSGGTWKSTIGTFAVPTSGKWYFEVALTGTTLIYVGLVASDAAMTTLASSYPVNTQVAYTIYPDDSNVYSGPGNVNGGSSGLGSFSTGDVIQVLYDADNGNLKFGKNNTLMASNAYTGLNTRNYLPVIGTNATGLISVNFGQRPFAYTAPSGYKALCTQNLPTPTIEDGSTAMDVVTYTGTGSALTPTSSLNFSPDLIWLKSRSATTDHSLYDTVRGVQTRLEPNQQPGDVTSDNGVTAFNSNGFTLGTLAQVNTSSATYVGWCWDAGSSNATNTDGSMTSTVRANASIGVSIVDFSATSGTVGHGLGVAPDFFVYKTRSGDSNWSVYHKSLGNTQRLLLNTTDAPTTSSTYWNNTSPTSTVITLGSNFSGLGSSIIYAFASVASFSSFGQYTGNGSADGPFIYTGFRPRWILLKGLGATYFMMYDTARSTYNVTNTSLYPGLTNADTAETSNQIDILSNGFKVRAAGGSNPNINPNGTGVVYAAFAENPFSLARAR